MGSVPNLRIGPRSVSVTRTLAIFERRRAVEGCKGFVAVFRRRDVTAYFGAARCCPAATSHQCARLRVVADGYCLRAAGGTAAELPPAALRQLLRMSRRCSAVVNPRRDTLDRNPSQRSEPCAGASKHSLISSHLRLKKRSVLHRSSLSGSSADLTARRKPTAQLSIALLKTSPLPPAFSLERW